MRAVLIAVAMALLAPMAAVSQAGWTSWNYPEQHMRVIGPPGITPAVSHQDVPVGDKKVDMTIVMFSMTQYGDAAMGALYADYGAIGMTADVDGAVRGIVNAAKDVSEVKITTVPVAGGQGREIGMKAQGRMIRARVVTVGARIYQMQSFSAPGAATVLPETDRFMAGLTVTP